MDLLLTDANPVTADTYTAYGTNSDRYFGDHKVNVSVPERALPLHILWLAESNILVLPR